MTKKKNRRSTSGFETIHPTRIEAQLRNEKDLIRTYERLDAIHAVEDFAQLGADWHHTRLLAAEAKGRAQALAWVLGAKRGKLKARWGALALDLTEMKDLRRDARAARREEDDHG